MRRRIFKVLALALEPPKKSIAESLLLYNLRLNYGLGIEARQRQSQVGGLDLHHSIAYANKGRKNKNKNLKLFINSKLQLRRPDSKIHGDTIGVFLRKREMQAQPFARPFPWIHQDPGPNQHYQNQRGD